MAEIQYALAVSKTSPYHYLLKTVDDVTAHDDTFPVQSSPVALVTADFTPDGVYVLAATDASGTTPFRLWKRTDEAFEALPTSGGGTLAVAETVAELRWLTDTHVVAVGQTAGCWFGVLNRTTDRITWTRFRTDTGYRSVGVHPNGIYFFCSRDTASVYNRFWKRTGDTVAEWAMSSNPGSTGMWQGRLNHRGMVGGIRFGASYLHIHAADWDANTFLGGTAYVNLPSPQPTTDGLVARGGIEWTKTGQHFFYGIGLTPFIGMGICVSDIYPTFVMVNKEVLSPALAAIPQQIRHIKGNWMYVVTTSATANTGRIRKVRVTDEKYQWEEDTSIQTIFSAWNMVFTAIAVSNPIIAAAVPVSLYDTSIEAIVSGSVDLTNLKIALMSNSATFNADHTTLAQVLGANEVYGSSWPQGGIATSDGIFEKFGTGADYALRVPIPSLNMADAGSFTFRKAVIYDDSHTDKRPLGFLTFDTDKLVEQYDRMQFSSTNARFAIFSVDE